MSSKRIPSEDIVHLAGSISSPEERRRYLIRVCKGDEDLVAHFESLVAYANDVDDVLRTPVTSLLRRINAPLDSDPDLFNELNNTILDGYQIVEQLGEGGFAVVMKAEPTSSVGPAVAIKVVRPGMDSLEVLNRFRSERAILAGLDHPNIVTVNNFGMSPHGRPYFIMELVRGLPITTYCDTQRLSIRDRLTLFIDVCDAVHYAHKQGVIHRDLKPANILVAEAPGGLIPKIIDFGVAKALIGDNTESRELSRHSQLIGTPRYMSPEQSRSGRVSDPRTDIYALAAVLYELILGVPHLGEPDAKDITPFDWLELLRNTETRWPSAQLRRIPRDQRQLLCDQRRCDTSNFVKSIGSDLESVLFRALQSDPLDRYDSIAEFRQNLQHCLEGKAVSGLSPTFFRAVRALAREHYRETAIACIGLILVIATSIIAVGFAIEARLARKVADANEKKAVVALEAERQARHSEMHEKQQRLEAVQNELNAVRAVKEAIEVNNLLGNNLFDAFARGPQPLDELTLVTALRNAANSELAGSNSPPYVQAAFHEALGRAFRSFHIYQDAETELSKALALRRAHQGTDHPLTLETEIILATLYLNMSDPAAAKPLLEHVRQFGPSVFGETHSSTLGAERLWVSVLDGTGEFQEAIDIAEPLLTTMRQACGAGDASTLAMERQIAAIYQHLGRPEDAQRMLSDSLRRHQTALGISDVNTLACQSMLADTFQVLRDYDNAARLYQETLPLQQEHLGADHHQVLVTECNLASVHMHLGNFDEAETIFKTTLAKQERVLGPTNPLTLKTQSNLAQLFERVGNYDVAEKMYQEVLIAMRSALGPDHSHTQVTLRKLATLEHICGKLDESEKLFRQALADSQRLEGPEHRHTLELESLLAVVLRDKKRFDEAETLFRHSLALERQRLGDQHVDTLLTLHELACLCTENGDSLEATELLRESLAGRQAVLGPCHPDTVKTERLLAMVQDEVSHDLTAVDK
ncbi:MAG: serine/threonine-protein kinase [Pirellulaceae bacterium]|nr:serine/threonine protein kinase [Planctomycetales bacterium]